MVLAGLTMPCFLITGIHPHRADPVAFVERAF
jgi:hypothetical protein